MKDCGVKTGNDNPMYVLIQDVYTIRGKQFAGILFDILNGMQRIRLSIKSPKRMELFP
jgi:hypothetical protein